MSTLTTLKNYYDKLLDAVSPRRRGLKRLRAKWGRPVTPGEKDASSTSRYFDLTRNACAAQAASIRRQGGQIVDDKTWTDLEFPRIFAGMDSTETPLGSQFLFCRLRCYVESPRELAEYYASCEALRIDPSLREEIQLRLANLQDDSNAQLTDFIFSETPSAPKYIGLLPWWSLACLATLVSVYMLSLSVWLWLATIGVNLILIFRFSLRLHGNIEMLKRCHWMLRVADALASIRSDAPLPPQMLRILREAPQRAKAHKALGWIAKSQGPLAANLSVWLNLMFLADMVAYSRTIKQLARVKAELAATFESLGSIDAAITVASYLECLSEHCQPIISDATALEIVAGQHPLIKRSVCNSIHLEGRSALITGSNMAGKTTFIKMIGINIIFGRTLGFCLASKATLPNSSVMASIRGEHSVESGKSHYFAELEAIHLFIERAQRDECKVFLIDELFNGTNTVERLAAARAVLECLSAYAQVLVTTHDVELQDDLARIYALYYFQEDPDVDGYFDYQLRSGKSTKRNAIELLARKGFPIDIVAQAMTYSKHYASLVVS